jgi:predicted secreted protein
VDQATTIGETGRMLGMAESAGRRSCMRNRLVLCLGLIIAVAALAAPAFAQEPARTRLVLSETATREVEQDTLVAVLAARAEAAAPREAQAAVNRAMTAAIEQAEAVAGVRAATGGYRVYQEYDRKGQPHSWIAEQDLRLTAREAPPLLELVGALQDAGLVLNGLAYQLSAEARLALKDELAIAAIEALRRRAEQVAASIAMRVETIAVLRVGETADEPPVQPMMRTTMAEAAAAPPSALPDLETVRASVHAELVLVPR